ncbi:type III secretion system protein SpaO [Serratia quinivorans]|uniref:FliM/FliN family flagellar motor switch protein n=1 Tax=Serratia quinivorans TaxID=137545 RepID=UPI0021795554|nr:FliM/FliN family flagellar motor switch protein [Serratia quinivorans]CAI1903999.1 type III secretion system protein SpaO [Serratia quinivorans]
MSLKLRSVTPEEVQLGHWQRLTNPEQGLATLCQSRRYLQLHFTSSYEQVEAWVDIVAWCQQQWPPLYGLAWEQVSNAYLVTMFRDHTAGQCFFGGHYHLSVGDIVLGKACPQRAITLNEDQLGTLLTQTPPAVCLNQRSTTRRWEGLRFNARWVLGTSSISVGMLQNIELRDALLIQRMTMRVEIEGRGFAVFQSVDEGVGIVELLAEEQEQEALAPVDEAPMAFDVNKLSVALSFVLAQRSLTLAEMEDIQLGSVFPFGAENEKQVKVYANQQLIAVGELIYVGDSLALEVTQLASLGAVNLAGS